MLNKKFGEGSNKTNEPDSNKKMENVLDRVFSFYKAPVTNKKPCREMTLADAFNYIGGWEARSQTLKLRSLTNHVEARKFKGQNFDYVMFSGTFSYGSDAGLIRHSGLICIDFDHVDVKRTKQILLNDLFFPTQLLFTSPSGDGVKWVVKIDLQKCDHRTWFLALKNYLHATYGLEADSQCINVSRACFLPHDAEVYVNPLICPF